MIIIGNIKYNKFMLFGKNAHLHQDIENSRNFIRIKQWSKAAHIDLNVFFYKYLQLMLAFFISQHFQSLKYFQTNIFLVNLQSENQ